MKRILFLLLLLAAVGGGAGLAWWYFHRPKPTSVLVLYGNVDLRQVQLAFNNNERIAAVLVQEGDRVSKVSPRDMANAYMTVVLQNQPLADASCSSYFLTVPRGQLMALLDKSRLEPQVAQAQAQAAAQRHIVDRLHHGSRPEEIAQARANLASAKADAANARRTYDRLHKLSMGTEGAVSKQDVDNAKAALDVAEAKQAVNQSALELAILGPRKEEIAENEARLRSYEAQLAFLRQQLADADLRAPADAIVRTRLLEPGDMASPQKPVFSLAIIDPKWVRAYVSETDLGKVQPGMKASIVVDSFPNRRFDGWVGFISPVAEFTPKTVQTEELRTSLVYEVRVFVKDPADELRLGMPATVHLSLRKEEP